MPKRTKRNAWKEDWITPKIVIGLDQSYTRTGIAMTYNGKLVKVSSIDFKRMKSKTEKRKEVSRVLRKYIEKALTKVKPNEMWIICEKIRTFSHGTDDVEGLMRANTFLSPNYIKSTGALVATIVDTAYEYGVKVCSVDTRSWKSAVLGTSKPMVVPMQGVKDPKKIREVKYVISLGFEDSLRVENAVGDFKSYNDDAADAACIALYLSQPLSKIILSFEE